MKPQKSSLRVMYVALFVFLAIMACVILLDLRITDSRKVASQVQNQKHSLVDSFREQLTITLQRYLGQLGPRDDWWMKTTLIPSKETAQTLSVAKSNVEIAVRRFRTTSPLTEEIAQSFPGFFTSVYTNGYALSVFEREADVKTAKDGKFEICFVSEEEYRKGKLPSSLYYRHDWNAVMIGGERWPEVFLGALLFHELGHALRKKQRQSNDQSRYDWVKEEVEMHELEGLVLNMGTKGKYFEALETIIASYSKVHSPSKLLGSITPDDLLKLDVAVGLENCGYEIRGISVAEHIAVIGFRFIDKNKGGMEEKVAHYRWITEK